MRCRYWVPLLAMLATVAPAAEPPVSKVTFEPREIIEWQRRDFADGTRYRLVHAEERSFVRARADDGATALYHAVEIDLTETPWLEWSWRVDRLPSGTASERSKAGDDYGARIYVVQEGLFGRLTANALNYVWGRRRPVGSRWPNAFTERAMMFAVASGRERLGEWVTHRRNVRADWQAAFGEKPERIHGIAIMTDSDNTDTRAAARYGTIRFTAGP